MRILNGFDRLTHILKDIDSWDSAMSLSFREGKAFSFGTGSVTVCANTNQSNQHCKSCQKKEEKRARRACWLTRLLSD